MFELSASTVFSKLFVKENKVRGNKNSFERIDVRIIGIPVSRFQLVNLSTKCLSVDNHMISYYCIAICVQFRH